MLPRCDGHVVAAAFLEGQSAELAQAAWLDQRRRGLAEWSGVTRMLGPASTPWVLLQTSAPPLGGLSRFSPARTDRAAGPRRRRAPRLARHTGRHHRHVVGGAARSA